MFVQLVVSTLILGSVVAVSPPKPEGENEGSAAAMTSFRCTFKDFEEHVKLFMDNLKVQGQALENSTSREFLEEMRPYYGILPKVETQLANTTCSRYRTDAKLIEKHFSMLLNLGFSDPLKWHIETLADKLLSLKHSVVATDSLFNVTYASCCEKRNETPCYPEASSVLNEKLSEFVEIKKNIIMDMNRLQEKVLSASNDVKKMAIPHYQAQIKEYECCLKGLGYSDKDNECEAPGSSRSTLPPPLSPPSPTPS